MANSAHQPGGKVRALESSSGDTMSKLAEVWYVWGGDVGSCSARTWCQVDAQIVVRIRCPKMADMVFWIHQTFLTLVKSDRRVQVYGSGVARALEHQSLKLIGTGGWPKWLRHDRVQKHAW